MKRNEEPVSTGSSFRALLLFQLKLALDAIRDVALSPLSFVAFLLDAIMKPPPEDRLFLRLMSLGRRSDQVINLFGEYGDGEHYTVDQTFTDVEAAVKPHWQDARRRHPGVFLNGDAEGRQTGTDHSEQKK